MPCAETSFICAIAMAYILRYSAFEQGMRDFRRSARVWVRAR